MSERTFCFYLKLILALFKLAMYACCSLLNLSASSFASFILASIFSAFPPRRILSLLYVHLMNLTEKTNQQDYHGGWDF